jgi:hypothetical protein
MENWVRVSHPEASILAEAKVRCRLSSRRPAIPFEMARTTFLYALPAFLILLSE